MEIETQPPFEQCSLKKTKKIVSQSFKDKSEEETAHLRQFWSYIKKLLLENQICEDDSQVQQHNHHFVLSHPLATPLPRQRQPSLTIISCS